MTKVLMVCLGNICRSPMAEGLLRSKVDTQKITVDSAGTSNYHINQAPDRRMQETARQHHINLSALRGRQFTPKDFEQFDFIYVMDKHNYQDVIQQARSANEKAKVDFITNLLYPQENRDVPDPYYGGSEGFENVFQLLDQCTDQLVKKLLSQ